MLRMRCTPAFKKNVAPSALVEIAGVHVGLVGAITETGLRQTLAAHVEGLATLPLAPTIAEGGSGKATTGDYVRTVKA